MLPRFAVGCPLEVQPQRELPESPFVVLAVVCAIAEAALQPLEYHWSAGEERSIGTESVHVHIDMVENVVPLGPELQRETFGQSKGLGQRQVKIPRAWTIERRSAWS